MPIFVTHFTQNPLLIGLISVITSAGFLVPQLFTANLTERAPLKKYYPFNLGFFVERLPVLLLAPATFFLAVSSPGLALAAFFVLITWQSAGAGTVMVAWQDMIAKIIPVQSRGRFFGLSNFLGNFTGILGASVVTWLLRKYEFPTGFVIAFGIASAFIFISWIFLGLTREPRTEPTKPVISNLAYFKALPQIIRTNPNFQAYLFTQIVSAFGVMGAGFLLVHAIQRWHLTDAQAASFNIASLLGQSAANLLLGFLADHKGHKIVLEISILLNIIAFILAIFAPIPAWFYLVFALRGMSMGGNFISGMSLPLEFSEPEDRPTFIGLAGTLPGIAGAVAPLLAGGLAGAIGYPTLFIVSTSIAVVSFGMMKWLVRDPRHHSIA